MKRPYTTALFALALSLGACSENAGPSRGGDPGPRGVVGDLGNGTFFYQCTDEADSVCDDGESDFPTGQSFVVGGVFSLTYRLGNGTRHEVSSSSSDRLAGSSSEFRAEKPGVVALIASSGDNATDVLHIHLAEMAEMQIEAQQASLGMGLDEDMLSLQSGDTLELRATAHDADGDLLAGAIATEWVSGDLSVVSFSGSDRDNLVELVAGKNGIAQIYVTMGGFSRTITVTVTGGETVDLPLDAGVWVPLPIVFPDGGAGGMGGGGAGGAGGAGGQGGQ